MATIFYTLSQAVSVKNIVYAVNELECKILDITRKNILYDINSLPHTYSMNGLEPKSLYCTSKASHLIIIMRTNQTSKATVGNYAYDVKTCNIICNIILLSLY